MNVGWDCLESMGDLASPVTTLLDKKLLLNSIISDARQDPKFVTFDLKDHFPQTVIREPKYMRIH